MATTEQKTEKKGGKKGLIIALIIILLGVNGYQLFKAHEEKQEHTAIVEEKDNVISLKSLQLDSLQTELQLREDEILKLGGDITALTSEKESLLKEIARVQRSAKSEAAKRRELEVIIKNYEKMLNEQDGELVKLREQLANQDVQINELKENLVSKDKTLSELSNEKADLSQKVAMARVLKAESFNIVALNRKGKEKTGGEYKVKDIDQLRINFSLAANKVALVETKTVYIQVKEPSGTTIYDLGQGSGTFDAAGKEQYYTLKKDVVYDRKGSPMSFTYQRGSEYKSGRHSIDVYCEGELIGSGSFTVK